MSRSVGRLFAASRRKTVSTNNPGILSCLEFVPAMLWFTVSLYLSAVGSSSLAQTLVCGDVIQGSIGSIGQMNTYFLSSVAGDVVRLTSVSKSGGVQPDIQITSPAGILVGNVGYNDGVSTLALTNTGIYRVQVYDRNHTGTGSYSLGVVYATPKCTATSLSCGQVVTNTFNDPAQQDTYSLDAVAGDVVRLTSVSKSGGVQPDIDVFNSVGVSAGSFGYNDGVSTLKLKDTGAYTVLVRTRDNSNTGTYTLGLVYATPKCAAIPLDCGQVITNTISDQAEQHTYTLEGNAGDVVRLTSVSKSGGVQPDIDVFNSVGVSAGSFGYNDGVSTLKLTATGTYTLLVRTRDNSNTGTYTLGLVYASPKCAAIPLGCGQVVTNTITDQAQQHTYTFSALSGEVIRLTSVGLSGDLCADVDVFNRSGTKVGSFGCNDFTSALTLPASDTYTVLARSRDNATTGKYQLGLDFLTGCARLYLGSAVVRTQQVACLQLEIFAGAPAVGVTFTVSSPDGYLTNAILNTGGRFTNATVIPGPESQWSVTLQTSATDALAGDEVVGSLCFTTVSTQSAFVPLTISNLMVSNVDGSHSSPTAFGTRAVIIADQPLLEAGLTNSSQRLLTLYGKANSDYEIDYSTNLSAALPWIPGWTNTVPASLLYSFPIQGNLSNTPLLLLRAKER